MQMLFVAAKRLMRANGNLDDFRSDRLAAEILSMFGLFHYMNSCALVTRQIAGGGADARVDAMVNIANGVRLNAIIEFLALYLASGLDLERPADDAIVDELRGAMLRWHHDSQPRLDSFDRGHSRAMRQGLFPRERRLDAFGQFAELVAQPNSFALLEIRRFCGMAETLGLSHPDLDLLAAMMARPAAAARTVRERQRIHLVAWVKGPDVDQPFSLTAHDGEVVFVFTTGVAADYFVRESRQIVRPGFRLSTTAIASPTEQNVVAILHRMLPDSRSDLQISFEGSAAFDRRFRELNDGTFWPADDADRPEGMSSSDTP